MADSGISTKNHFYNGYEGTQYVELRTLVRSAKRQVWIAIATALTCVILSTIYISTTTKLYTASANILIDGRTFGIENPDEAGLFVEESAIDSQVEIIKSQRVVSRVIDKLNLVDSAELNSKLSFYDLLFAGFDNHSLSENDRYINSVRKASELIANNLTVTRFEKTLILKINFTTSNAVKAAQVANAIADSYLIEQLNSKHDAMGRVSQWLQDRIVELREKSLQSDRTIQTYREKHGLIQTNGRLINDQALQELMSQLTVARSQTALAEARYAQIKAAIDSRATSAAVPEALQSSVITDLRVRYLTATKRLSELNERLVPGHIQIGLVKQELIDYERQIFAELNRISDSVKSEVNRNKEHESALQRDVDKLVGANAADNSVLVALLDMEREAENYRNLYQSFMGRNQELMQQQSYPVTEARILSRAVTPTSQSKPRVGLIIALSMLGGLAIGSGVGILREYRDSGFRTGMQVHEHLDIDFLGIVPIFERAKRSAQFRTESQPTVLNIAVIEPLSRTADTMQAIKLKLDSQHRRDHGCVLGIISCYGGEGKTTIASNLAMTFGSTGASILLVDGDLRLCGLSQQFALKSQSSLVDVIQGGAEFSSAVTQLNNSNVWLLGSSAGTRLAHSSEILRSDGMKRLMETAVSQFDYVIIDLPPIGSLVDTRAIEPFINNFLLVVKWGSTSRDSVISMIASNDTISQKCIGAILNKVNVSTLSNYNFDHYMH